MSKNSLLNKIGKWVAGFIIGVAIVLMCAYFMLGSLVKDRLEQQVARQTKGAYTLTIDALTVNILSGSATATAIHLIPDTVQINRSKNLTDIYEITAPQISIKGMNLWQLLSNNHIEIDQLAIINPKIKWIRKAGKADVENAMDEPIDSNELPRVKIAKILLNESGLEVLPNIDASPLLSFEKASLRIDNFLIAGDNSREWSSMIDFDDLTLSVKDYKMKMADSLNIFSFDSLKASVKHSTLMINGMASQPRYGKYEYSRRKGVESDRIAFYNKELYVKGLDFRRLKAENQFIAQLVVMDSINAVLYRDKTHPVKPVKRKKLIQETIREAPFYILVDEFQLHKAQITYQEKVEKETAPGNINFVNLQASIRTITNDSILLKEGATMKAQAQTYVMGVGKIQANFEFPIADKHNTHSIKGTASAMPMEAINPMLKYVAFSEIVSGKMNSARFEAQLNEDFSTGTVDFFYEDLKIDLLKKGDVEERKGLISFLSNTFVIKSANPLNDKFRQGEMYFERDKNKSMINFWWKTLFSGLKDTMGMPTEKAPTSGQK